VSSLTTIVVAGSSLPADLASRLRCEYGWATISFYGCSDGISINTGRSLPVERAAVTVGRSDERISVVNIVDEAGAEKPPGEVGEITGLGPFTPMCYLNSPELDALYRSDDGWVKSGDLGFMDSEGFVSIVGRSKDIVIRGGFNISPQEIDDLLMTHPDVVLASCVGVPHERLGEQLCAVVVLRQGATEPTVESLGQFLLEKGLSTYKLPERLWVRSQLPTNPVGKILKRVLRDEVAREFATQKS
jgi:acyl-CoA synthetase